MARIEELHAAREESLVRLASPRPGSPRGGQGEDGWRSPRERLERARPMASFVSGSPRSLGGSPERARSPIVAERALSPGPGTYEVGSQFVSGARLRRAQIGAGSAFRSNSPRFRPLSPRSSELAPSPGPGAYNLGSQFAGGAGRQRAHSPLPGRQRPGRTGAAFGARSPRFETRRRDETPSPVYYNPRI
ncbi:hypothetical protein T492DRAFT_946466 [Pavlovales sp. CCMP2436]|nr:hypothetical protein T492DRAFT_946466 [Pavlovales sp. CCMP2436]